MLSQQGSLITILTKIKIILIMIYDLLIKLEQLDLLLLDCNTVDTVIRVGVLTSTIDFIQEMVFYGRDGIDKGDTFSIFFDPQDHIYLFECFHI